MYANLTRWQIDMMLSVGFIFIIVMFNLIWLALLEKGLRKDKK